MFNRKCANAVENNQTHVRTSLKSALVFMLSMFYCFLRSMSTSSFHSVFKCECFERSAHVFSSFAVLSIIARRYNFQMYATPSGDKQCILHFCYVRKHKQTQHKRLRLYTLPKGPKDSRLSRLALAPFFNCRACAKQQQPTTAAKAIATPTHAAVVRCSALAALPALTHAVTHTNAHTQTPAHKRVLPTTDPPINFDNPLTHSTHAHERSCPDSRPRACL